MPNKERNLAVQVQALTLFELGIKIDDIIKITGFPRRTIYAKRGYDPVVSLQLTNSYLEDAPKSGRPPISLEKKEEVESKITTDHYGREKNTADIAVRVQILQRSVARTYIS